MVCVHRSCIPARVHNARFKLAVLFKADWQLGSKLETDQPKLPPTHTVTRLEGAEFWRAVCRTLLRKPLMIFCGPSLRCAYTLG